WLEPRSGPDESHPFQQSHAGISAFAFPSRPGLALLETFNSVSHLGENLPKTKAGKTGLRLLLVAPPAGYTLEATHLQRVLPHAHADCIISGHSPSGRERLEEMIATAEFSALATVLVIVPQQELCAMLGRLLHMDEQTANRFQLRAMSLTVIHYPGRGRPPVLQAVNLFDGAGEAAGLQCLDRE